MLFISSKMHQVTMEKISGHLVTYLFLSHGCRRLNSCSQLR